MEINAVIENVENDINVSNKLIVSDIIKSGGAEVDSVNQTKENCVIINNIASDNNVICTDTNANEYESTTLDKPVRRTIDDSDDEIVDNLKSVRMLIDNSDDEIDNIASDNSKKPLGFLGRHKKLNVIDSDSEEDELPKETNINQAPIYVVNDKGNIVPETKKKSRLICNSDTSEGEESHDTYNGDSPNEEVEKPNQAISTKSLYHTICDPDTSDDDVDIGLREDTVEDLNVKPKSKIRKKTKSPTESDVPKKITAKDALKLRKEIQSVSQRMTRESSVRLPYHKPKSRTLKEFLQNRPRFAAAVPLSTNRTPPSVAIKMSKEQLKAVSEKISEREKEVEQFFKSESESEGEEEETDQNSSQIVTTKDATGTILSNKIEENVGSTRLLQNLDNINENVKNITEISYNSDSINENINDVVQTSPNCNNTEADTGTSQNCDSIDESMEHVTKTVDNIDNVNENIGLEEKEHSSIIILQDILLNSNQNSIESSNLFEESAIHCTEIQNHENKLDLDIVVSRVDKVPEVESISDATAMEIDTPENNENEHINKILLDNNQVRVLLNNKTTEQNTVLDSGITAPEKDNHTTQTNTNTPDFEFTLDDTCFGEDESQDADTIKLNKLIEKYTNEDFTNECTEAKSDSLTKKEDILEEKQQIKPKSRLDLIKEKLGDFKPQLKGSPDLMVDLESGTTRSNEVSKLIQRFINHTKKKTPQKHNVKLDIVSVSGGEVHKETVELSVNDDEPIAIIEKPGERLQKLRDELKMQMAQKRSEMWQQRNQQNADNKTISEIEEKSDCDAYEDDILDNEDEEAFTESEEEENEEDLMDDVDYTDEKKTEKSIFVDEEAEESDVDDNDDDLLNNEDEQPDNTSEKNDDNNCENDVENEPDVDDDDDNESEFDDGKEQDMDGDDENDEEDADDDDGTKPKTEIQKKRKLKRIIKAFSNDSDDDDDEYEENAIKVQDVPKIENRGQIVLDSTDTVDELCPITPHQKRNSCTPIRKRTQSKSELGFLTPVVQLTGLQSLNSGSKFLHESPISPFVIPADTSPIKSFTQIGPQKQLFPDNDSTSTQELSEVAALCSGIFPSQTQETEITNVTDVSEDPFKSDTLTLISDKKESFSNEKEPSAQDLLEICSGKFTGITQNNTFSNQTEPSTQDLLEICSGKFTGITQLNRSSSEEVNTKEKSPDIIMNSDDKSSLQATQISISNNEIKSFDTEDKLISELLNEEEMENFKKKFDTPLDNIDTKSYTRVIYDSSDEENEISPNKKKKTHKRLVFSDDDSGNDENQIENEEINLHDEDDDNVEENEIQDVEYDSEENVELEAGSKKLRMEDFLENEAELSESEWGSADEDEKGLDELEFEEADNEKIDENQVKRDLEKIHMRRLLDDDNHEVKLLQELLLDDGELHGSGRERQFRWKNIDTIGNETDKPHDDDGEIYLDDEADEEKWRKMRYEREIFLKKQQEKSQKLLTDDEEDIVADNNSQIFKLGQAAIKRCSSNSQNTTPVNEKNAPESNFCVKGPLSLLSKKGSFLTRSDQVLARVAEFTKISNGKTGTKNSKNFVFQSISEETETLTTIKKRKATDGTPNAIKKLRLNNFSPATQKIGKKENNRAKSLFSVW